MYGLINEELDFHITKIWWVFRRLVPLLKVFFFWEPMSVDMRVVLLVEGDTMGKHLHPYIEFKNSWGSHMHGLINEEMDFHTIKIDEPFGVRFHFWKIFGNRCRLVWRSYSWSNMTRLYTFHVKFGTLGVYKRTNKKVDSRTTKIWRAFWRLFHFEKIFFLGNRCR